MNKLFIVDEKLMGALIQYLSTQPFMEVAGFIQALTKLPEVQPPSSPVDPPG